MPDHNAGWSTAETRQETFRGTREWKVQTKTQSLRPDVSRRPGHQLPSACANVLLWESNFGTGVLSLYLSCSFQLLLLQKFGKKGRGRSVRRDKRRTWRQGDVLGQTSGVPNGSSGEKCGRDELRVFPRWTDLTPCASCLCTCFHTCQPRPLPFSPARSKSNPTS